MNRKFLSRLGWDERLEEAYQRYGRPDLRPARVSRAEQGVCTLLAPGGVGRASAGGGVLAAAAQDAARLPGPGDWVMVRTWPDGRATVEAVFGRRTMVRDASGSVLASNVDIIVAVEPGKVADPAVVGALRQLAAPGRTLGLIGGAGKAATELVNALAGGTVLAGARDALVPLPDGGAVIDIPGDRFAIDCGAIDGSPAGAVALTVADLRGYPTG